jgi:hypothetical protein
MEKGSLQASLYLDYTTVHQHKINALRDASYILQKTEDFAEREDRIFQYFTYPIEDKENQIFDLVGRYKITRVSCGQFQGKSYACKNHPEATLTHKVLSCGKLGCPVCAMSAISRRSITISERIYAIADHIKKEYNVVLGKPKHISFNVQCGHIENYEEFKEVRRSVIKNAEESGLVGGVIFHHPLRINEQRESLYESHHFHVIGFGHIIKSDIFYEKYGYTYTNHGSRDSKDACRSTISYILSHAGLCFYDRYIKHRKCYGVKDVAECWDDCRCGHYCAYREKSERHRNVYAYFGVMRPDITKARIVEYIDVPRECSICKEPLYEVLEGIEYHFLLNPKAENRIKLLEWANYTITRHKYYTKHKTKICDGLYLEKIAKDSWITDKYNDVIEEYRKFEIIDNSSTIIHKDKLEFGSDVLFERIPIYEVTIKSHTKILHFITAG